MNRFFDSKDLSRPTGGRHVHQQHPTSREPPAKIGGFHGGIHGNVTERGEKSRKIMKKTGYLYNLLLKSGFSTTKMRLSRVFCMFPRG